MTKPTKLTLRSVARLVVAGLAIALTASVLAACGSSSSGGSSPSGGSSSSSDGSSSGGSSSSGGGGGAQSVTIQGYAYHAATITVKPGAKVTWTNKDSTNHTATADSGGPAFTTGTLGNGASKTVKAPTKPGTYPYHCTFHAFMHGKLIVK